MEKAMGGMILDFAGLINPISVDTGPRWRCARLNLLRVSLTAIGVINGVAGIIVLGAAGGGANEKLEEQIANTGRQHIERPPRPCSQGQRGPVVLLVDEDAKTIKERVPDIQAIARKSTARLHLLRKHELEHRILSPRGL
jgi:hypothetical protein